MLLAQEKHASTATKIIAILIVSYASYASYAFEVPDMAAVKAEIFGLVPQVITMNTTVAGGNAALLASMHCGPLGCSFCCVQLFFQQ